MQNKGLVFALAVVIVLMVWPVAASDDFTLQINGVDYRSLNNPTFTWGDTIRFSGTNNLSDKTYFTLEDPNWDSSMRPQACKGLSLGSKYGSPVLHISVKSDKSWVYEWDSGEVACKYPNQNVGLYLVSGNKQISVPLSMREKYILPPALTPTPTPTPDYDAKIRALETKLIDQDAKVSAQETQLKTQSLEIKKISVTTIPTATPKPTATIDHAAIEAALEKRLAEVEAEQQKQGYFLYQIMKFLGLG